jgi:hypothetical protein
MSERALSPRQIQHRRRVHAKGRKHFILYTGVLRFGGLMFVATILRQWHGQFSWHLPRPTAGLFIGVLLILLLSVAMGYFWCTLMWDRIYSLRVATALLHKLASCHLTQ